MRRNTHITRVLHLLLAVAVLLPATVRADALGCGSDVPRAATPACCCGSDLPVCPMAPVDEGPAMSSGCGCATPAPPTAPGERPRAAAPEIASVQALPASDPPRAACAPAVTTIVRAPVREAGRALLQRHCVILI